MGRVTTIAVLLSVMASASQEGKQPAGVPARYAEIARTKLTRLVEVLGTPEQDPAIGHTAAFSRDGSRALYAGGGISPFFDNFDAASLSLWDVKKGSLLREWKLPKAGITALAIAPDGRHALLAVIEQVDKGKQPIYLSWRDLETGKEIRRLKGHDNFISGVVISADGKQALSGSMDGSVKHWDLSAGKEGVKLAGHAQNQFVPAVAFDPEGKTAASGGHDGKVRLWDLKTAKEIQTMDYLSGPITMAFSPDGARLACLGLDSSIKIWEVKKAKELRTLESNVASAGLGSIAFTPDGKKLLAVLNGVNATGMNEECYVRMWDIDTGKQLWSVKTDFKGTVPVHYEKGLLGGGANRFSEWDFNTGRQKRSWGGHKAAVSGIVVTGNGVISAGQDGVLVPWRGRGITASKGHGGPINAVAVSRDDKWLVTGSTDKTVKAWKAGNDTWEETHTCTGHGDTVTSVAVTPDGKFAVSGSADRLIKIWELSTGKETDSLAGHSHGIMAVAVSPDGAWIASGSDDNTVRLWPIKAGKLAGEARVLDGHKRQVMSLAFSPDGKRLLSGSQDMTLKLWDVAEETCVKTLKGHTNWVNVIAFRSNDQAISASDDLTVRVWDLQKGVEIDQIDLGACSDVARSLALDPRTNSLLVGTAGWVILRFELRRTGF